MEEQHCGGTPPPVIVEVLEGLATVRLSRPEAYNVFDLDMIRLLAGELISLARREDVLGVVVTGSGRAFCAGGDLRWIAACGENYGSAFHQLAAQFHQAVMEIRRMQKPVVAALNGLAAGGGFSLALACDFRVMERSAVLRQAYTSNGLSIDGGGSFTLPRMVGAARAMEIMTFDEPIRAEKALDWGLVTEIVDDGRSLLRALEMAKGVMEGCLTSFAASKRLILESFGSAFAEQLELERECLASCGGHPNGREGVEAFLEKRKPRFRGL